MTRSENQNTEEIIKELCLCNGLSYEKIDEDGEETVVLEMFFSGYPRMEGLSYFPNLTVLTLVGQSIQKISGLESCPLLKELWIAECQLTQIENIHYCSNLEKLYLYHNKIAVIENLERLTKLEVIWLNNNQIEVIQGLHTLQNIKDLNLAGNLISKIGNCLDPNEQIERLNLSGNRLCSFKELTNLARLPHLKDLGLGDPQYSPNPVCLLCNYAIHVLFHMPELQRLDTYDVTHRQVKDLAESTVMKKIMYYNMRVKTVYRQLNEMLEKLKEEKCKLLKVPEKCIKILTFTAKHIERELTKLQVSDKIRRKICNANGCHQRTTEIGSSEISKKLEDATEDLSIGQQFCHKLQTLKERITFWTKQLDGIDILYQEEVKRKLESKDLIVQFLLTELETVGNIRFEEGCPSDTWYNSCYDLILSRFCAWDFKMYGVTGVKIKRISKVNNRILRQKFEEAFQAFFDQEEINMPEGSSEKRGNFTGTYRRMLEYLFYVFDPKVPVGNKELLQVLEDGFKESGKGKQYDCGDAVMLSNSLSLCEVPRIEYLQQQEKIKEKDKRDPESYRYGKVIIAKVFLGHSIQACGKEPIRQIDYLTANSVFRPRKTKSSMCVNNETIYCKEHTNCDCSLRHCEWFVFDHELVLPEYIIEFEYITLGKGQSQCSTMSIYEEENKNKTEASILSLDLKLDEEIINMKPVLKPRPKIISLDEKTVLSVAKARISSDVVVLNLHGNSLTKLKDIARFTGLRKLIISFNEFSSLEDVSYLSNLEYLDASHNRVITLEGFKNLAKLKYLDLSWNQLKKTKEINTLCKHASQLLTLHLGNNPWQKPASVHFTAISRLRTLTHLDGIVVTEEVVAEALRFTTGAKITQMSLLLHARTDKERPHTLSLLSSAQILSQTSKSKLDINSEFDPKCYSLITSLTLDGQKLYKIANLERLEHLQWASFNNNNISKIEGLEHCFNLEELSFDENCISKLEGISKLTKLVRLSVNNNQLTDLDQQVIDNLSHLHFLSAENNSISSMAGLQKAYSLIELYLSNNKISTNQEIYHLKNLNNLVILDLYGNLIQKKKGNYRMFVIFHLPALKALDGDAIDSLEIENAKDVFGGRLTSDMIVENCGKSFLEIEELNWKESNIRNVDLTPVDQFRNVQIVNLENNSLTSFSGLIFLPNVKILNLNYNHIESILPRQKSQNHLTNKQILHQKVTSSGYGQQTVSKTSRDVGIIEILSPVMESLEELHLGYNGINNLPQLQLSRLKHLKSLFLEGNEITQIDGLESLYCLQELVLDHNRIKVINESSFVKQSCLLELHLEENRIRELNNLQPLIKLKKLFIGYNKIQEMSEVEKLEAFPTLKEISVFGNPISRKMYYRPLLVSRLPRLQVLDGTSVSIEERSRAELHFAEQQTLLVTNPAYDVILPGSSSVLTKQSSLRVTNMTLSGGMSTCLGPDHVSYIVEDTLSNDLNKYKKSKPQIMGLVNSSRSIHGEIAFRQLKGGTSNSATHLTHPNTFSRTIYMLPSAQLYANNQESESRIPNNGNYRPN
uniref:Leucine-rich repeat-containing protein 9 isoform X2 n=1 Tax=Geotrypetes seraphini TaxID=260995 RepID=A0A6P8RTE1_GEOSA|nr:leucine-rich repeat-containing protein 9 isoform X2 [Geotrypetes seraphini]